MPTLTQQETMIRAAAYKGFYFIAGVNPSINDDRNKSFIFGSRWLNTVAQEEFVCIANEPGAAVWLSTTSGGSSGYTPHVATSNPTINDDSGDGYTVGLLWLNTVLETCFIAVDVSLGAAVWVELTGGGSGGGAAVDITADADPLLTGTNVQSQLTSIANILRNAIMYTYIVGATGIYEVCLQPPVVVGYNLQSL